MITAQEAKALYAASGAEATTLVDNMEAPIRKACASGSNWVFIYLGAKEDHALFVKDDMATTKTAVYDQAMVKLKALGFTVRFCTDGESYVPRGLADDDGNGPKYINYGFMVGW